MPSLARMRLQTIGGTPRGDPCNKPLYQLLPRHNGRAGGRVQRRRSDDLGGPSRPFRSARVKRIRLARSSACNPKLKAQFEDQAKAYRKLAIKRAEDLGLLRTCLPPR